MSKINMYLSMIIILFSKFLFVKKKNGLMKYMDIVQMTQKMDMLEVVEKL